MRLHQGGISHTAWVIEDDLSDRETGLCKQHREWCGWHTYPCVGTPFEDSRTALHLWFYALYLFSTSRHNVPAKELERQLGVT